MLFCVWFLSLSIMFSGFLHVVISTSFLFTAELYSIIWIFHILFTHSSVYGHLRYFHFLAIMNKAAVNICGHIFVWTRSIILDIYLGVLYGL